MPEFILTVCVIGVAYHFWLPYRMRKVIDEYEKEKMIAELLEENIALQMELEDLQELGTTDRLFINQYMN